MQRHHHIIATGSLLVALLAFAGCAAPSLSERIANPESTAQTIGGTFGDTITAGEAARLNARIKLEDLTGAAICVSVDQGVVSSGIRVEPVTRAVLTNRVTNSFLCQTGNAYGGNSLFVAELGEAGQTASSSPAAPELPEGELGVNLNDRDNAFVIADMIPGAPAAQSGSVQSGDRIIGFAEDAKTPPQSTDDQSLSEVRLALRGEPGSSITLFLRGKGEIHTREVSLTRAKVTDQQRQAYQAQKTADRLDELVIDGNGGQYMSPYTSDGVVAEWVDKAINADIGGAAGSSVGAAVGAYAGKKALESIPGGSLIGGFLGGAAGAEAGGDVGRDAAIEASGGWRYIRQTSDLSFRSLDDMAQWLVHKHADNPTFNNVIAATSSIYPKLSQSLAAQGQ